MKELTDSFFYPIHEQFTAAKDFDTAKALVLNHINNQDAKGKAVQNIEKMKRELSTITNLTKLQFWFFNNILAYTNCRVAKPIPR